MNFKGWFLSGVPPYSKHWRNHTTLVIVDMEPAFCMCADTIAAVIEEIKYAKTHNYPVVVVEFSVKGGTHKEIMDALNNFKVRYSVVLKHTVSGAREVIDACLIGNFPTLEFRVCGAYTHACVEETAKGICSIVPDATVSMIEEACYCPYGNDWSSLETLTFPNLRSLSQAKNVA